MTSLSGGGVVVCERCGAENGEDARFCSSCGNRLGEGTQEERKLVSVLFVDLEGFTTSSDQADPEDVRDLLEEYHRSAKACIEQFGGTLEKFIGDAVMAVFGVPSSYGDDAERAVRAGLRVLERVHESGLAARAAVNTGEAVVRLSESISGEAIALGDVVNTAARLQSHAPTGRLIVGEPTYRATRHAIRYEPQAAISAKGKADPVTAWLVVEPLPERDGRIPPTSGAFVGRRRELQVVGTVWEQAITERRPHLLTLLGSPGVGKSRLCREVAALVGRDNGRIVRGRCLPYEEKTGYQAFTQMVRQVAGIFDSDPADVARTKLARAIETLFPPDEAPSHARDLTLLLGLGGEERAFDGRVLFYSARRLVERLGEEQPTLVVVEDVHWAAASELDLFEYLTNVRETRVVFIALARPELLDLRPSWGGGSTEQTRIALEPLGSEEAAELAAGLLPDDETMVQKLVEIAGGNPLFIEELAASAAERSADGELPVTVRAAIAARIDSLPPDARSSLLSAAVIGRTFWQGALSAVSGVETLDEVLDDLERRDLVRREPTSRLEGDVEWRFKHALIRDVAYGTLPRAVRKERHAAIARFVEEQTAGADSFAWVLAHHWREADMPDKAVPYLLAAASIAQQSWATHEVVDLCSQALELTQDVEVRARIRLRRAFALILVDEYPAALEDLESILSDLHGSDLLDGLLAAGKSYVWTERDAEALDMAERALSYARELGDRDAEIAATALVSEALAMRGEPGDIDRAVELGDEAVASWRPGVRGFERADHSHIHGDLKYWVGDYAATLELATTAQALGDDVHSVEAVLRGGGLQAMALCGLGRHEEALAALQAVVEVERELGGDGAYLRNYTSMVLRELNDLPRARETSELALERARTRSFGMPRRFAQSDLLLTALLEGDVGRAQVEWGPLWEDAQSAPAWTRWLIRGRLAANRAEIELRTGATEAAVEWAQTAIDTALTTRRRKYEAIARSILGEALARLGQREAALSELRAAVDVADALVGQPARYNARAALAMAAYSLGEDDVAATATAEGRALVEEFAATLAPERADLVRRSPVVQELFGSS